MLHSGRVDFGEMEVVVFGRRAAEVVAEGRASERPAKSKSDCPTTLSLNCFKRQRRNIEKTGSREHDSLWNCVARTPFRTLLIWDKGISFRPRAYGYPASTCSEPVDGPP